MAAVCVVALKFVIYFCRGLKLFLKTIYAHERRRAVHFVKIKYLLRDIKICSIVIQFLFY